MTEQQNNPPAFQLYPKDFMQSAKVAQMTNLEIGVYFRLICLCWTNQGLDPETRFDRIIGPDWADAESMVLPCFEEIEGRLWNPRLYRERQKQLAYKAGKSRAGKASARARKSRKENGKEQSLNSVETKGQRNSTLQSTDSVLHTSYNSYTVPVYSLADTGTGFIVDQDGNTKNASLPEVCPIGYALTVTGEEQESPGHKFYIKALDKLGRPGFLDCVMLFQAELEAGERVKNKGATLTAKLKRFMNAQSHKGKK